MNIQALVKATNDRLQESLPSLTLLNWFNDAQNIISAKVGANFPSLITTNGAQSSITEPVWDSRFHDLLVTYACARFRESDEATGEAQYLDGLFYDRLADVVSYMVVPDAYKVIDNSQTFLAAASQTTFTITHKYYISPNDTVRVFVNDSELLKSEFTLVGNNIIISKQINLNDKIYIIWENDSAYTLQPMPYQGSW